MSIFLPAVFALYPLVLSGVALIWFFWATKGGGSGWQMHIVASGSIMSFVYQAGSWVFTSYYLRFLLVGFFLVAVVFIYRRNWPVRIRKAASLSWKNVVSIVIVVLFMALNAVVVAARYPSGDQIDLNFPLRSGTYAVLQGGSNVVANPFHALSGNPFPIDLVKLNSFGNRAKGLMPRELSGYEIFGELVHSPCDGTVLTVRDGMADNTPGTVNLAQTEGNFIRIACDDAQILMAHLKSGSLLVSSGSALTRGQAVGRVGNSGNSMEPHLHVEASRDGQPISLRFEGRVLIVNDTIRPGT